MPRASQHRSRVRDSHRRPPQRRSRAVPTVNPLIVPRSVAAKMLSVSTATLIRMEAAGRLTPVTLTLGVSAPKFYRVSDLEALVGVNHAFLNADQ